MLTDARHCDLSDLRRFGLALARDDRFVSNRDAAEALVERLFRQASMEVVDFGLESRSTERERQSDRVRAFGQFIRLYRRHIRRLACEQGEAGSESRAQHGKGKTSSSSLGVAAAVRMLPLELREAILIVVLARFTHRDAALALDIPLAALIDRLTFARGRLALLTRRPADAAGSGPSRRTFPHLRLVK